MREKGYSYRSFEHFKRETFSIIAAIAGEIDGPIRMADISCGPAVLEGILLTKLGARVEEVHLLDIDQGFLDVAREYLADFDTDVVSHVSDLNAPDTYPDIRGLNLIVSTNALFHATADSLPKLYGWCRTALAEAGVLINHQTFGHFCPGFDRQQERLCPSLHAKAALDDLDRELMRRSRLDSGAPRQEDNADKGGGYAGLPLSVFQHLELLHSTGFIADEIWRRGTSAMIMAVKRNSQESG